MPKRARASQSLLELPETELARVCSQLFASEALLQLAATCKGVQALLRRHFGSLVRAWDERQDDEGRVVELAQRATVLRPPGELMRVVEAVGDAFALVDAEHPCTILDGHRNRWSVRQLADAFAALNPDVVQFLAHCEQPAEPVPSLELSSRLDDLMRDWELERQLEFIAALLAAAVGGESARSDAALGTLLAARFGPQRHLLSLVDGCDGMRGLCDQDMTPLLRAVAFFCAHDAPSCARLVDAVTHRWGAGARLIFAARFLRQMRVVREPLWTPEKDLHFARAILLTANGHKARFSEATVLRELQRYAAACRFTADAAEARFALEWLASCSLWPCNGFRSAELEIPSSCVCGVGSSCSCRCCPLGGDLRERLLFRVISGGTSAPLLQHVRPARHCAIQ